MKLYKCPNCGKDVPDQYKVCPFCRNPMPEPKASGKKWPYVVMVIEAVVIIVLALGVIGLSGEQRAAGDATPNQTGSADVPSQNVEQESASIPPSQPAAPQTVTGSGTLGDYAVEIKGARLVKDYEDKPAILITYAWTNNSDKTTSAMVAVIGKAFQDGVQMEPAILYDVEGYEAGNSTKDVRPGTTIDIQSAYVLTSDTSTVEFELSELISFSDNIVSMDFDPAALS